MSEIFLPAALSLLASMLTAYLTSKITRKNEMRKIIHEKRLALYTEAFETIELILKEYDKAFDRTYFESVAAYKAKIKLLGSTETVEAYRKLYDALRTTVHEYEKYAAARNPENLARCAAAFDDGDEENGTSVQPSETDFENYEYELLTYQKEQKKTVAAMRESVGEIVEAMRRDLGSSLDEPRWKALWKWFKCEQEKVTQGEHA